MDNSTFDIINVSVVFQSSLKKTSLFTKLSDMGAVVVCHHLVTKDSICHLKQNKCPKHQIACPVGLEIMMSDDIDLGWFGLDGIFLGRTFKSHFFKSLQGVIPHHLRFC